MSRRHSRSTLETLQDLDAQVHEEQWWEDIPEPRTVPDDWQQAWAATTLNVCDRVWSKQGAKLYFGPKNTWLRDDLHSWLFVKAQELANNFTPDAHHPTPERQWGAYLWTALNEVARWHFQQTMGGGQGPSTRAAVEAHNRGGVRSLDHLEEMHHETGYVVPMYALHSDDTSTLDPALIVIHAEDLAHDIARAEAHLRTQEQSGVYTTRTEICLITGCDKVTKGRTGLCQKHYDHERNLWATPGTDPCPIPGCDRPVKRVGICDPHATKYYDNRLPEEYLQYVKRPGPKAPPPPCSEPGCEKQVHSRGLCSTHYQIQRRARLAAS